MRHLLFRRPALLAAAAYAVVFVLVQACSEKDEPGRAGPREKSGAAGAPGAFVPPVRNPADGIAYVGSQSCAGCHAQEHADWLTSDHHKAMLEATEESVLGDFADVTFSHFGHTWRFFRKEGKFFVNAEDADGGRRDFEVAYTFGHEPLQQYLVPYPGGRYQALQVCWDSRPAAEGGQRWFHLYPDEEIPPDDPLHWTRPLFNWNYMCADCHSTDLKKGYDLAADRYDTTFAEINVGCEACHGPGENHLAWAAGYAAHDDPNKSPTGDLGLVVQLKEPGGPAAWTADPDTGKPVRTKPLDSHVEVETCARCHAHRRPIQADYFPGQASFLDTHHPTALDDIHYHHDGQIDEEVYVYGSFRQSKMFHHGVRCTDCHHPHTMDTYVPDNRLCSRCHLPARYDSPEHHHHPQDTTGARCVTCHMPGKLYMVVDLRLDHSLRIPRPDLSEKTGAPNACTACHTDKDNAWAARTSLGWWGEKLTAHPEFGTAFASGEPARIRGVAQTPSFPAIVRASALQRLGLTEPSAETIQAFVEALGDGDPAVRLEAVGGLEALPPAGRAPHLVPMLYDPVRAVRVGAARLLAPAVSAVAGTENRKALDSALAEFREAQAAVADRPGAHMALALLYADLGLPAEAEKAYRTAIRIAPEHVPSHVNLAEHLQQSGRADEALTFLQQVVAADPTNSVAREAMGRFFVRQRDYGRGVAELKLAADLDPERAPIQYFYGVALNSVGRTGEAFPYLERAHRLDPTNPEYLVGLATVNRDAGRDAEAVRWAEKLVALDPQNPQSRQLLMELQLRLRGGEAP